MGLRDIEASLPPGFRFHPSDEELVCHYLFKKIANEQALKGTLVEIDLHTCEPWQLPDMAKLCPNEWYFFSFRDRKYATGFRTNRATISGYWKATGKDRTVHDPQTRAIVGMRKTLVFYKNRAPTGIKTGWIMHEFRLENPNMPPKEDWVLCRVSYKGRVGDNNSDDNSNINQKHMYENTLDVATSPFSDQGMLPNTDLMTSFELNSSLFELAHHLQGQNNNTFASETINLKYEDGFGCFSGMTFSENGSGEYHVDPNLVEMGFEFEDDRGDGSLLFL